MAKLRLRLERLFAVDTGLEFEKSSLIQRRHPASILTLLPRPAQRIVHIRDQAASSLESLAVTDLAS